MYETATWRGDFFLHDWSDFHAYDYVHYGLKSFSMHFPGKLKVYRVAKTWVYLNTVDGQRFDADSEEGTLTEYAARLLREHLAHYSEPAIRAGLKPHAGDNEDVEQCLRKAAAAGYAGVDLTYDEAFHAYTELYMVLDLLTGVPTVVFITVPDKTAIPEPVQANIQSWRDLNPGFEVVVHDDRDLEFLVMLLVPRLQETWPSLLKVQQADIYRFLVTAFLGGVYADSDTVCKTPVADWLERPMGLILGVEAQNVDTAGSHRHEGDRTVVFAQYAFATGAFHPVLIRMLHRIMGGREELLGAASPLLTPNDRLRAVLGTTGPTAWTDVVAEYFCYAQSGVALTPDVFWRGGGAPAIEILPIAAFGAGQTHSGAPAADHPNVLIYHKFKGSVVLRGEKWMQATE